MGVRIRERDGAWWIFIHHNKQRKAKRVGPGEAGKKAAKDAARLIQARLALGQAAFDEPPQPEPKADLATVGSYLKAWLKEHAQVNCKPSTYAEYSWCIEHILLPEFGTLPLDALTVAHVRQIIAKYTEAGKSRATIRNYLAPLRAAFTQAEDDGLVSKNPAAKLGKLLKHTKGSAKDIHPLTRQETATLLDTAKAKTPLISPLLFCAVRTGLRRGELIGLQWGDIDLAGRSLLVRRAVVRGVVGPPKSGKPRRVDLSAGLCAELTALRAEHEREAEADGEALKLDAPVFRSPRGFRWDEHNLDKLWRETLKASGIRKVRLHDLRHTFASQLIEQGAYPKYIQEQLGHASITMTMDTYGHLFPNRNRGLVDGLDSLDFEGRNATPAQLTDGACEGASLSARKVVRPTGLEPVTPRSVVWCSIH
ncbi:putative Phage integrase [Nitrospira japonica]|uniref:Putative Phage integrase n=1 Tax=Nitrospira japonica TaxID=1325564 RepID=A0A1W1I898_9BACT|nr:putative Phage integrase [Nitrospira japonica]